MGCAFPVVNNFILFSGGFTNLPFYIFSFSGLILLGFGDTFAAVIGKRFG
jgi:dolichol kinase